MSERIDVLIIGAGPAGVAAGIGARLAHRRARRHRPRTRRLRAHLVRARLADIRDGALAGPLVLRLRRDRHPLRLASRAQGRAPRPHRRAAKGVGRITDFSSSPGCPSAIPSSLVLPKQ